MRTLVATVLCVVTAFADGLHVTGQVTDAKGQPTGVVEYGTEWTFTRSGKIAPFQPFKVGADGAISGNIKWLHKPMALLALSPDRKSGAILELLDEKDLAEPLPVTVQLGPAFEVKASLACPDLGSPLGLTLVRVVCRPSEAHVYRLPIRDGRVAVHLPPGEYELRATTPDTIEFRKPFTVENAALDLGALTLELSVIARAWGKPPPAFSGAERGADKALQLADLKGKWVLVIFWSATNDDATRSMFPRLIEFVGQQKDVSDKFAILALHDPSVKSWEEYDAAEAKPRAGAWGGKPLPFPVLLDATGDTFKAWGIGALPVAVLVDPEGKVVKGGNEYVLMERLRGK